MKNYDETVNSVFNRIHDYRTAQIKKRKLITRITVPTFSVCLAVVIGFFAFKGDIKPPLTIDDSSQIGEKDYIEPNSSDNEKNEKHPNFMQLPTQDSTVDVIGSVKIEETQYIQYQVDSTLFTADKYLGDAREFEGSYKQFLSNTKAELYTVKESSNVLMVKLGNGGTVILGRVGEIIINGKTYFSTQWIADKFTADKYLGKASDYEIIEVPYRESFLVPDAEISTAKENNDILLVKLSNGDILIYSVWE